jgi:hypothetical protein
MLITLPVVLLFCEGEQVQHDNIKFRVRNDVLYHTRVVPGG